MNPDLPSAVAALLRHGPRLAALADYLHAGPADDVVLVDRAGALTRHGLSAAVDAVRDPSGAPLRRVTGSHDRTPLVAALAAALDGADVLVVHPATPTDEAVPAIGAPRGRLWLGTSGTTRVPRVSARPRYGPGLLRPVRHAWRRWGLADDAGPVLVQPPLHHGYGLGMALAALVARRTVLLPSGGEGLATLLAEHRPQLTVSVPSQLAGLPAVPGWRPRVMVTGSGPLPVAVQQQVLDDFGPVLHNLFGSTEAGFATMAGPADLRRSPGCVGRPLPGVRIRLVAGRLEVRSPFATDPYGWVATGDRAHLDGHGLLVLDGRIDRVAVVDGLNLCLDEVVRVLRQHPAVSEADADTVPDPVTGQRVEASVRLCRGVTAHELEAWVRQQAGPRWRLRVRTTGPTGPAGS